VDLANACADVAAVVKVSWRRASLHLEPNGLLICGMF
jgi:hypothetical protein